MKERQWWGDVGWQRSQPGTWDGNVIAIRRSMCFLYARRSSSVLWAIAVLFFSSIAMAGAQIRDTTIQYGPKINTEGKSWVRVVPGAQYDAGAFHRFFFGGLWRDLWMTPIDVPVLRLDTFAGGLTPYKRGGGFQTKSLRFTAANGRQYKFRSLDKDPTSVLPEDLRETFVGDIVQDFIATSNPVSMVVAVPIINAAGVINAEPMLVVLPDDPRLGEYRETFGGLLGALEENPIDDVDEGEAFAGAEKIILTPKLFARLQKNNDERVDARAYLTARLIDVYMGDWDRHTDQWKWARFEEGGQELWRPIPRDRDQAFCRYNGIIPDLVEAYVPQIEGTSGHYPALKYLTWSGRYMDNRFLSELDRETWDSIAAAVSARITDSVIDHAVHRLPSAMYAQEGENLHDVLLARRDQLRQAADEFYLVKADVVDIHGSDKAEFAEVIRTDDDHVAVTLYDLDRERHPKPSPLFQRLFNRNETDEIRLYMEGGDDSVLVRGDVSSSILVRVIGGDGADVMIDRSHVDGWLFGLLPVPSAATKTRFYDGGKKTNVVEGASTSYDDEDVSLSSDYVERYEPPVADRGFEWLYFPWVGGSPDLGAFLGASATVTEWGFRVAPYRDQMIFRLGYATAPQRVKAEFDGDFRNVVPGTTLTLLARFSGIEVLNFYGIGNTTVRDADLLADDFYRVEQQQGVVRATLGVPLINRLDMKFGVEGRYTDTEHDDSTLLAVSQPYGIAGFTQAGALLGLTLDTRDNGTLPRSGLLISAEGTFYPALLDVRQQYIRATGDARMYLTTDPGIPLTLGLRAAGTVLDGDYPYFDAAFLGGLGSLRGFDRERFAGDASALGAAELRATLGKVWLIVPATLHLFGFAEAGRVFADGEESEQWHPAYGGGVALTVVEPANTISVSVGRTKEQVGVYVTAGFGL